jgi:hypothetical protein
VEDDDDCDIVLDLSVLAMVPISPDSSTYVYSEDDPLYIDPSDRIVVPPSKSEELEPNLSGDDMGEESNNDFMSDSDLPTTKRKREHKDNRKARVNRMRGKVLKPTS